MMKKNGFTLAEVLITLAIIGVVAIMTLPALITNVGEQQYKTGLKKGINTLTEASQMNQALIGYGYGEITSTDTDNVNPDEKQSLYALLTSRANVDLRNSGASKLISQQGTASETADSNFAVFFRDGSALLYDPNSTTADTASSSATGGTIGSLEDDGLPYGITAIYDTNGTKGPNIVSNCQGAALGVAKESDTANCGTKSSRVIKDQFCIRLRGSYAVPNGPAARWAFEN